jgi:2-polyprenyl-3-methyl-5-hydroxy-6-metoxy-1,4-benzoquinol methylase
MTSYFEARQMPHPKDGDFSIYNYLKNELPENREAKILDIGCGFGLFLSKIKELGYTNVSGVDIDVDAVNFCKEKGYSTSGGGYF